MNVEHRNEFDTYDMVYADIDTAVHVGGIRSVSELPTDQFDAVISVCQDCRAENVGCTYEHIPLADSHMNKEEWGGAYSFKAFIRAVVTVYDHMMRKGDILVHCHHGVNRSVSVVVAAICLYERRMMGLDRDPERVLDQIQFFRPVADPYDGMWDKVLRLVGDEE